MSVDVELRKLSEGQICRDFADDVVERLVASQVRALQEMASGLSGECSGLSSVWEEVCVQVQGEHSFYWETYLQTIRDCAAGEVDELKSYELEALWLTTEGGDDWDNLDPAERDPNPVCVEDVVELLIEELLSRAGDFQSPNISEFLNRDYE